MKRLLFSSYIAYSLVFSGCSDLDVEHITGKYYLVDLDYVEEWKDVSYKLPSGDYIGIVNETVFAIGYDDNFIIAKQHPSKYGKINKNITNYFIIPITQPVHEWPDENKIGPLTKAEFIQNRNELGVPNSLEFTRVFKDLE